MLNWAGNVAFSATEVVRPSSISELQHVMARTGRVRAFGTGHSFNTIADTPGTMISTALLDLTVELDSAGSVALVPGGWTYAQVASALQARGHALHNLGSLPHISVAGACATGTHGSGATNGCLASAVEGVEFVRADGELVEFHRGHPDFPGMVLSLGRLGVVTRLWLDIQPTYDVSQEVLLDVPVEQAAADAEKLLCSAYSVSLFSTFTDPSVLDSVWRKSRGPDSSTDTWGGQRATRQINPIPTQDPAAATKQLGHAGPWHERLPHFRTGFSPSVGDELQSEFFVPRHHAGELLRELQARASEIRPALQIFEMRTIAADDLWLSPFHGRDTVALHATWVSDLSAARPCLAALESVVAPYDPRPHWGKVFLGFDSDRIAQIYPNLARFATLAAEHDPGRRLGNGFLEDLGVW